jgi:hypothetical protein
VPMFGRKKTPVTDSDRLSILELTTGANYTPFEISGQFADKDRAILTLLELVDKNHVAMSIVYPDRRRELLSSSKAHTLLEKPEAWTAYAEGQDKYVAHATDHGWRWHQKNWKPF